MDKINTHVIYLKLKGCISDYCELECIKEGTLNVDMRELLVSCLKYSLETGSLCDMKLLEIDSILDFLNDELNSGHWSDVPIHTRHYFTIASFVKCLVLLKTNNCDKEQLLKTCLKCLDIGLLLGAPLENNLEILTNSAKVLREEINKHVLKDSNKVEIKNKRKITEYDKFSKIPGILVDSIDSPSIEYFNSKWFLPQTPVKLTGCLEHWPASKKWLDLNYLLELAGDRTVPVEIGSHYVDANWSQKLMTLKEFITKYYVSDNGDIGYLAQHNLFEQITELKDDICIPEYCCLSLDYENSCEPDINAWFGPKGTLSPLHTDPKNNLLAQVYGTKQVILFSPKDTEYLYPHEDKLLNNTAQVDPLEPDLKNYPNFVKSTLYKCLLEPGDMLFIPVKWWHHVTALDKSFSVSFWWQ
ncbi:lysine-specific demethylase 8 isoform X1 [Diorhabda sublineata]|uniref:lysine-specific demethylase 8 isoform X1 n=1 Tax=Diorhabda sublineata TaxID=1163346 RepID=UPI0024E05282|nr:lysine-specific demethylase 8 isoform X1 [Diorhabda sublineata]